VFFELILQIILIYISELIYYNLVICVIANRISSYSKNSGLNFLF